MTMAVPVTLAVFVVLAVIGAIAYLVDKSADRLER